MKESPDFNSSVIRMKTIGRRTGRSHEVELWFASRDRSLYLLAHKDSDWWKNIHANPEVQVRLGTKTYLGRALVADELRDEVFEMFQKKYGRSVVEDWYGGRTEERKVVEITIKEG